MPDSWDSALYDDRHSFVWRTSADLIDILDPQAGERILDLGCGTGHPTAEIAARGAHVLGLDSSTSMIAQARQKYPKLRFTLADARDLKFDEPFDAVFSNAALHWIPEASRVIAGIAGALKPGGRLVLEMGAKGNIATIVKVLAQAIPGGRNPWYFPSAAEYARLLEEHGFEIRALSTFERWHKLEHPEKGMREWLEMFAGAWFEGVAANARNEMAGEVENRLRASLWCDGAWWADYKRLRVIAWAAR